MGHSTKIATCCYCGTRAALVLRGDLRHELACSNCGAPLHNLKVMPALGPGAAPAHFSHPIQRKKTKAQSKSKRAAHSHWEDHKARRSKTSRKKRTSRVKDWVEDVFDVIEDIFD
ncbi:hypothetical protein [Shimia sp. NS0008-38b]|uniref:hypothetical protein n=1 Tax=Shimia sp. NS0008-38b TaxID=3127653 RepID=UPI00333ED11B